MSPEKKVIITSDSAGINAELAKKIDVGVIPVSLGFGKEYYTEGVDIDSPTFLNLVIQNTEIPQKDKKIYPKSAAGNVSLYENIFKDLLVANPDSKILHVSTGKKWSSMYANSQKAAENIDRDRIVVFDTETVGPGTEYMVKKAAVSAKEGKSREEIIEEQKDLVDRTRVVVNFPDLSYLEKGGRGEQMIYALASKLHVEPVLELVHNKNSILDAARSRNKSILKMVEIIGRNKDMEAVGLMYGGSKRSIAEIEEVAQQVGKFYKGEIPRSQINLSLLVHAGPNVLAALLVKCK
jgi:DegV family protein with EDD domain